MTSSRKIYILLVGCFVLLAQLSSSDGSFLEWIWPKRDVELFGGDSTNLPSVRFELSEANDKFIRDTSNIMGVKLSGLDFCQQRVILSLKQSCNSLTEEELGKLSVALLNCQLQVESRDIYECADSVSLKDCTSNMSPDLWSAYNLIFSRAKTVCLTIRQEQFRGLAELTINKLMSSTHQHLDLMEKLKGSQQLLEKATLTSLDEITESHLKLLDHQQEILQLAEYQRVTSEANVREILREKNLLKIGTRELHLFISDLRSKINEGLVGIQDQNDKTKETYNSLLTDLDDLNVISSKISAKLEEFSQDLGEKSRKSNVILDHTIHQLETTNQIVNNFSAILTNLRTEVHTKMDWIENYLGKDNLIGRLSIICIHVIILLVGMLCLVFVDADLVSRFMFLSVLAGNLVGTLCDLIQFNLTILVQTICMLLLGNFLSKVFVKYNLIEKISKYYQKLIESSKLKPETVKNGGLAYEIRPKKDSHYMTSILESSSLHRPVGRLSNAGLDNGRERLNISSSEYQRNFNSHNTSNISSHTRNSSEREGSVASASSRRSYVVHPQCSALTARGTRCSFTSTSTRGHCAMHSRNSRDRER